MWAVLPLILLNSVMVFESVDHDATTEGDTVLATDPDTAYSVAADYSRWAKIFPSIRATTIGKHTGDSADVTFTHRDGSVEHLRFRNRPQNRVIAFQQVGGDAEVSAEIVFQPGRTAGTTWVHTRLHADVHGVKSWFVSDGELRSLREQQVRQDLIWLQAYFAK